MALPPLATPDDLQVRAGGPIDDPAQAEWLLAEASAIARRFAKRTWVDEDGELVDVPDGVPGVVVEMVLRVLQNPEGVTQDTAGPSSLSFGPNASDRLYLTWPDKLVLRGAGTQSAFSILTVPTASPMHPLHDVVVNGPED